MFALRNAQRRPHSLVPLSVAACTAADPSLYLATVGQVQILRLPTNSQLCLPSPHLPGTGRLGSGAVRQPRHAHRLSPLLPLEIGAQFSLNFLTNEARSLYVGIFLRTHITSACIP